MLIIHPRIKVPTFKPPKWINSEIKHLSNYIHTLKCKLKKSYNATKLANLCSLELELHKLISNPKEDYKTHLLTTFSHNPKVLYHHLGHLSKFFQTPQCPVRNSSPVLDPTYKVEAFITFFNLTFTVTVFFLLPSIDPMPTSMNQLSYITIDESDVFEALTNLSPSKAQCYENINPYVLNFCATSSASPLEKLLLLVFHNLVYHKNGKHIKSALFLKRRLYRCIKLSSHFLALQPF